MAGSCDQQHCNAGPPTHLLLRVPNEHGLDCVVAADAPKLGSILQTWSQGLSGKELRCSMQVCLQVACVLQVTLRT
jgi:hypothetical protein